jgi:hypothetical protein
MDRKRITANGIHHFVKGAEHDKDSIIRETLTPEGFSVLEITVVGIRAYNTRVSNLQGTKEYLGLNLATDQKVNELGPVALMQHFLEVEKKYISRASFSTSVDGNPQVSGNMYADK